MGDIELIQELSLPSVEMEHRAREVAIEHSFARGALGRGAGISDLRYGTVATSTLGMEAGKLAFVVAIQSDGGPYQMIGTPVNYDAPLVEAPCQIVVLSSEGEFLFSYRMQFEADASSAKP